MVQGGARLALDSGVEWTPNRNPKPNGLRALPCDRQRSQRGRRRRRQRDRVRRRGAPDAASTAEQNSRPHKPSNHGCGDNGGSGATAKGGTHGSMAEAGDIGQHRATTCEKGETVDVEGEFPSVGETAAEMMHGHHEYSPTQPPRSGTGGSRSGRWPQWGPIPLRRASSGTGPMWSIVATWLRGKTPLIGSFKERITSSPAQPHREQPSPRGTRKPPGSKPRP